MSEKLSYIPYIKDYAQIRREMENDLEYRLSARLDKTSLGRPLYKRIKVQVIMTHECPYHCPFCLERLNPMEGKQDFRAQFEALAKVLLEHKDARVTLTGGEPSLYCREIAKLVFLYKMLSNNVFIAINTTGYDDTVTHLDAHVNLSVNDYVNPDPSLFRKSTVQTVVADEGMRLAKIKEFMRNTDAKNFSFRFLSSLEKHDFDVTIWNELQNDPEVDIHTFRIGDFFVYATFDWNGYHARVTLGDMYQQKHNNYKDGYSNIIIHPDGKIGVNWN